MNRMPDADDFRATEDYRRRIEELEARIADLETVARTPPPAAAVAATAPKERDWKGFLERYAILIALAALIILFMILRPGPFTNWSTYATILSSNAVLVVLTLGLLIPLTAGDFDLSVAATLVFSAMSVAILNVDHDVPVIVTVLLAIGSGVVIGAINAFFILYFRIHSLIVTLGMATFIQGIVLWMSESRTISGVSMDLVRYVIIERIFGVSLTFFYAVILCGLIWYVFEYTTVGRKLLFVGRGREVARLSGIPVDRMRAGALIASGAIAGLAGVLYSGMTGSADPSSGLTLLLPAFAGAFLGATSIVPGRFNPWGSFFGVFFLVIGITGLTILGADTFVQNLFYGGGLIIAVALSQIVRNRRPQQFS